MHSAFTSGKSEFRWSDIHKHDRVSINGCQRDATVGDAPEATPAANGTASASPNVRLGHVAKALQRLCILLCPYALEDPLTADEQTCEGVRSLADSFAAGSFLEGGTCHACLSALVPCLVPDACHPACCVLVMSSLFTADYEVAWADWCRQRLGSCI